MVSNRNQREKTMSTLKQIAALENMSQAELKEKWRELFGTEPPAYRRGFLVKGLAYRLQELTHGGLSVATERKLTEMVEEQETSKTAKGRRADSNNLIRGTRLVREWQGVEHHVTTLDDGFEWQGKKYKSLSAVARAITGTRWSGPLFFGIRKHKKTT